MRSQNSGSVLHMPPSSSRSRWVMWAQRLEERPFRQHEPTDLLATGKRHLVSGRVYPLAIVVPLLPPVQVDDFQRRVAVLRPSRNSCVVNAKLMLAICPLHLAGQPLIQITFAVILNPTPG